MLCSCTFVGMCTSGYIVSSMQKNKPCLTCDMQQDMSFYVHLKISYRVKTQWNVCKVKWSVTKFSRTASRYFFACWRLCSCFRPDYYIRSMYVVSEEKEKLFILARTLLFPLVIVQMLSSTLLFFFSLFPFFQLVLLLSMVECCTDAYQ